MLKQLEGKTWNTATQLEFAKLLRGHPEFEGSLSADDPAFSARDRATRAPRLLGFVHFPKKGVRGGTLRFTEAGNAFLDTNEDEQLLIFQRQLAKEKLNIILHLERILRDAQIKHEAAEIRADFQRSLDNISTTFTAINDKKSEILDRPLMYEWNTWRSMVLINDAKNVQGNYTADADGNPISTASGKQPDILVEYSSFWLCVEVTLQRGLKQYEAEGESVVRHVGMHQKTCGEENDDRPVFGLFVAESIHPQVLFYLMVTARAKSKVYGGPVRVVPMQRDVFEKLMVTALNYPNFSHMVLKAFFEQCFVKEVADMDESEWMDHIEGLVDRFSVLKRIAA